MVEITEYNNNDDDDENSQSEHKEKIEKSAEPSQNDTTSCAPPRTRQGVTRLCDACGLGPREPDSPLKRCSICHQVWYHDRNCQSKDFARHKKICKRLARQRQQQERVKEEDAHRVVCRVEESTDRGRCLVANNNSTTGNKKFLLTYGTVLGPHNTTAAMRQPPQGASAPTNTSMIKPHNRSKEKEDPTHWQPMVAPVLLENHRRHRCAVCFGLVLDPHAATTGILEQHYPTRLCSDACRRTAASFLPSEQQAIAALYHQSTHPPRILPTAVLLYRLVLAMERDTSGERREILKHLQSERKRDDTTASLSQEEEAHQQAVCATTWAMIRAITTLPLWHFDDLHALLNQIKLNGFSVCTGESVALGIGLYTSSSSSSAAASQPAPNLVNHNCRPNLLQTFDYGVAGRFPALRLTVCVPQIADQEELTISYIDPSLPRRQRLARLKQDYGFHCRCTACGSPEDDEGVKCTLQSCPGTIVFPTGTPTGGGHCDTCEAPVPGNLPDDLMNFQALDSEDLAGLEKAYQFTKQRCRLSSWYVHECGERLLQALLDDLGNSSQDAERQYSLAAQAFQLTEELLQDNNDSQSFPKNCFLLKRTLLRYKGIKLRLFLNVHPTQAMQELEQIVFPACAAFFPGHHEIMRQIVQDCCS